AVRSDPLELGSGGATDLFDPRPVLRPVEALPRDIEPLGVVADVEQSLLPEAPSELRIQSCVDLAAVHDRRLAALSGRLHAAKGDLPGPAVHVRALVVKEDRLIGGIRRRSVDLAAHRLARQISVLSEQLRAERRREPLELGGRAEPEPPEENRAVLNEIRFEDPATTRGPIREIELDAGRRLEQKRPARTDGHGRLR